MSSEAPPSVIDTTLQNSTREYQKRQVAKSNMNWNQHVQTFYKSTQYNKKDVKKQSGLVYTTNHTNDSEDINQ